VGHTVEPVADHLPLPDSTGLLDENKECSLKGVLGVVIIAKDTATNSPDHRPVTLNQGRDSGLVPMLDKSSQQLPIRQPGLFLAQDGAAKLLNDFIDLSRHRVPFVMA
jgi:hypothetical protein